MIPSTVSNTSPTPTVSFSSAGCFSYGQFPHHPFVDGNKRIGVLALLTLLELNGYRIEATDQELTDIIMGVASGQRSEDDLNSWVINRISM